MRAAAKRASRLSGLAVSERHPHASRVPIRTRQLPQHIRQSSSVALAAKVRPDEHLFNVEEFATPHRERPSESVAAGKRRQPLARERRTPALRCTSKAIESHRNIPSRALTHPGPTCAHASMINCRTTHVANTPTRRHPTARPRNSGTGTSRVKLQTTSKLTQ